MMWYTEHPVITGPSTAEWAASLVIVQQYCQLSHGKQPSNKSKKVKWSRYRPGVAQRVGRGIALLFHDRGTRRGWVVSTTPRPHLPPGKTRYPFYRRLGGPQGRSGWVENLISTRIRSRTIQPVAQLLYQLSYPAPATKVFCLYFIARTGYKWGGSVSAPVSCPGRPESSAARVVFWFHTVLCYAGHSCLQRRDWKHKTTYFLQSAHVQQKHLMLITT